MKKLYLLLVVAIGLFTMQANAQCGGGRYYDEIFANYEDTTVVYSTTNQSMNIYWPSGDAETVRPVIIFAHGGSFYAGDRNETTIVELCKRFAKRGYVTASIDYRLGSALDMFQESTAYPVVVQAISDGKAAIRYFRRYATEYGVDQNKIYFGGNSAGSILGIHLVYISDTAEAASDPTILAAINANGGIDGNSGNPGYSWHCSAMVDWAGGIKDTTWFSPGDPAIVSLHGNPDGTVPYNCGQVLNGISQVTLCGPGVFVPRLQNVGIGHVAKEYPGGDHQPWGGGGSGAVFEEADSITKEFLFNQVCNATGIKTITSEAGIEVYPNPANTIVNIKYEGQAKQISLIDGLGRTVFTTNSGFNTNNATINIENFAKGVYFVKVDDANGSVASRKLIVE